MIVMVATWNSDAHVIGHCFVPVDSVKEVFGLLRDKARDELVPIFDILKNFMFEDEQQEESSSSTVAEKRNQYESVLDGSQWRVTQPLPYSMGKNRLDLYSVLMQFQTGIEIMVSEFDIARNVELGLYKKLIAIA